MHICRDSLFYGVLFLDNPTSPLVELHRLTMTVFAVGCILALMCFVGGCGAATECICFLVSVRPLHLFNLTIAAKHQQVLGKLFPFSRTARTGKRKYRKKRKQF